MAVATKKSLSLIEGGQKIIFDRRVEKKFGCAGSRLLQQVHFWCETHPNRRMGQDWCYNTYEAWAEQLNKSSMTIKRAAKMLVGCGVLVVGRFNRMGYDRTLWYRVDYARFSVLMASAEFPIVTKCYEQTLQNVTNKRYKMLPTIPEMITEKNTESSSENSKDASIKAGETCKALQEQQEKKIGQEQKHEQKHEQEMQTVVKSGQITLFRKGKVSGSPVSFGELALQVGTGEVSMATAKEILAKQSAVGAKAHKLPKLWQKEKARQKGKPGEPTFQNALTVVEMSQLKKFGKNVGDLAEPVMLYAMTHWPQFMSEAKNVGGVTTAPVKPHIGFLLKYCETAVDQYIGAQKKTSTLYGHEHVHVQSIAKAQTHALEVPKQVKEEAYKPTAEQIAATLDSL